MMRSSSFQSHMKHSCHLEGRGNPLGGSFRAGPVGDFSLCVGLRILALNDIGLALYIT